MSIEALRRTEILSALDDDALAEIASCCTARQYETGATLWQAGDQSDELLIVESGELDVWGPDGHGGVELIARVGPGECVGEMGLLLDERRSATVTCGRATSVLALDRESFQRIANENGAIDRLAAVVARRAAALTQRRRIRPRNQVVVVVSDRGVVGSAMVAARLVALARERLGRDVVAVAPGDSPAATARALPSRLDAAQTAVIDAGDAVDVDEALACADVVVHVTERSVARRPRVLDVVIGSEPIDINACEPFVLRDAGADIVLERLTRKVFGTTVGLALGGGAAFGIAHVGVLLAFEQAGIPIDIVAGTSFGAIVAIGAAAAMPAAEMVEIARRLGNVRTTLSVIDPVVNGSGLLAGRRLMRVFGPLIPQETFTELAKPCRVIATDIENGQRVDLGSGSIDLAVRASCSIPLIFMPVGVEGRTLVDGGMIDPVPADVAREMGADIVIGVNVVPRLEPDSPTALSRALQRVNRVNPLSRLGGGRGLPHAVDVLMKTLQVVQYELGSYRALAADVPVDVDLAGFNWLDFHRALDIIERGRKAGEAAVPLVQAAIAERLAG